MSFFPAFLREASAGVKNKIDKWKFLGSWACENRSKLNRSKQSTYFNLSDWNTLCRAETEAMTKAPAPASPRGGAKGFYHHAEQHDDPFGAAAERED